MTFSAAEAVDVRTARSFLFVPGDRPERFDKAARSGADAVLIDLEDAVAPNAKAAARQSAVEWLSTPNVAAVRINSSSVQRAADLEALHAVRLSMSAVIVPKCESPADIAVVSAALPGVAVIALLETASGIQEAASLARVPAVARLAFGNVDFALDTRIVGTGHGEPELRFARSALVIAARAANLPGPIDGVHVRLCDPHGLRCTTEASRNLGFAARLCLHPEQIATVHAAFAPTMAEMEWATKVIAAAAQHCGAAVRVEGQMIDTPLVERARVIMRDAHLR